MKGNTLLHVAATIGSVKAVEVNSINGVLYTMFGPPLECHPPYIRTKFRKVTKKKEI